MRDASLLQWFTAWIFNFFTLEEFSDLQLRRFAHAIYALRLQRFVALSLSVTAFSIHGGNAFVFFGFVAIACVALVLLDLRIRVSAIL